MARRTSIVPLTPKGNSSRNLNQEEANGGCCGLFDLKEDDAYAYRKHGKAPCGFGSNINSTKFKPDQHRKYLGKYYFVAPTPEVRKETASTFEEQLHPIEDAMRDQDSRQAYYEFLEGMQQINQQEYLDPKHLGQFHRESRDGWLYRIKAAFGFQDLDPKEEHLAKLATWEREMRRRANAFQTQLFTNDLRQRSLMKLDHAAIQDSEHNDRMPIRKETAALLTRPLEMDWTLTGALLYVVNILISAFALWQQIRILVGVCPVAFMCPSQAATAGKPVLAPPIAFRVPGNTSVGVKSYVDSYRPWNAKLDELCSVSDPDCEQGGYLIQWPYVQETTALKEGRPYSVFPQGLKDKGCTVDTATFVYNPHTQNIKREYWECPDQEYIPFISTYTKVDAETGQSSEGLSEFTFKPKLYRELHARTLECIEEISDKFDADWLTIFETRLSEAQTEMRSCITDSPLPDGNTCNCDLNSWNNFAIGLFYESETTSKCSDSNLWCKPAVEAEYARVQAELAKARKDAAADPDNQELQYVLGNLTAREGTLSNQPDAFLCRADESCEPAYPEEQPLHTAQKYGCFFTSEVADHVLPADYSACTGVYAWGSESRYQGMTPMQRMKQETLDLFISKRTVLVIFFLIKEGTIFTAKLMQLGLFLAFAFVFLVVYALFIFPLKLLLGPEASVSVNATIVGVTDGVMSVIELVGNLCLSLSTCYRTMIKARQVAMGLVNPSIRDMNDKITSVANTVFSLAVLLTLEDGNDSGIVSSMTLTLVQLIFQMTLEKMKLRNMKRPLQDLNENRLSKFEVSLLWVKIMEEFLSDDVQYNWVQIFNSKAPLKPFNTTFPETLQAGKRVGGDHGAWSSEPEKDRQDFVKDKDVKFKVDDGPSTCSQAVEKMVRRAFQALVDVNEEKLTYQTMTHRLDPELAVLFGHDGLRELKPAEAGCMEGGKPWHGVQPVQSVVYQPWDHGEDTADISKLIQDGEHKVFARHFRVAFNRAAPGAGPDGPEGQLLRGTWAKRSDGTPLVPEPFEFKANDTFLEHDMFEFQPRYFVYRNPDQPFTPAAANGKPPALTPGMPAASPGGEEGGVQTRELAVEMQAVPAHPQPPAMQHSMQLQAAPTSALAFAPPNPSPPMQEPHQGLPPPTPPFEAPSALPEEAAGVAAGVEAAAQGMEGLTLDPAPPAEEQAVEQMEVDPANVNVEQAEVDPASVAQTMEEFGSNLSEALQDSEAT